MAKKGKEGAQAQHEHESKSGPRIVDHVSDSEDEEISEDEAFNSEDERKYGALFAPSKNVNKTMKGRKRGDSDVGDSGDDSSDGEDSYSGDGIASDDDDEEGDGGQYMLDLLNNLDGTSHEKKNEEKQAAAAKLAHSSLLAESEFSSAAVRGADITLDSLMTGISNTKGFSAIQRTFRDIVAPTDGRVVTEEDGGKRRKVLETTKAPVSKVISERAARKVNYAEQSDDVKRWTEAVKQNREAETLDFRPKDRVRITRDELVGKFEPTTDFEKEVAEALEKAGARDEKEIARNEKGALLGGAEGDDDDDDLGSNRIGLAEFKKRRGELAKVRALMFYEERKRHHINKIKSKKYRKIRKKQRERMSEAEKAAAVEEEPNLSRELEEKEEMERMRERMTLAHKNTSKWAKRVLRRGGKVDTDTRRALSAQLQTGENLRKKIDNTMDGAADASEDECDGTLLDQARAILQETEKDGEKINSGADEKKGLFSLAFMKRGMELQRERATQEARQLLQELEANASDDDDDAAKNDGFDDEELRTEANEKKKKKALSAAETEKLLPKGKFVASALEFGNSNSIAVGGGIDINLEAQTPETGVQADCDKEEPEREVGTRMSKESTGGHTATLPGRKVDVEEKDVEDDAHMKINAAKKGSSSKRKIALVEEARKNEAANPWVHAATSSQSQSKAKLSIKGGKRRKMTGGVNKDGVVDVHNAFAIMGEDSPIDNDENKMVLVEESKPEEKGKKTIASLSQDELVRRAFAAPAEAEVEEEFEKEKNAMRERDDPTRKKKEDNKFASGWGSWAGEGAPAPRVPRKLPKKLQPPEKKSERMKRKDDNKKRVIINEKRVKKNAKFQIAEIPYPYSSREQYERAMTGGIGQEWNVSGAVKEMTRPEIVSRCGKIIAPIAKKAKAKRAPAKF